MKEQRSILTASLGLLLLAGCGGGLRSGEVRALGQSAEEKELLALTSTGERSRAAYSCAWDGASHQLQAGASLLGGWCLDRAGRPGRDRL